MGLASDFRLNLIILIPIASAISDVIPTPNPTPIAVVSPSPRLHALLPLVELPVRYISGPMLCEGVRDGDSVAVRDSVGVTEGVTLFEVEMVGVTVALLVKLRLLECDARAVGETDSEGNSPVSVKHSKLL